MTHNIEDEKTRFQKMALVWENQYEQREFDKRFEISAEPLAKIVSRLKEENEDLKTRLSNLENFLAISSPHRSRMAQKEGSYEGSSQNGKKNTHYPR